MIDISVIVPVYKTEATLLPCVQSILRQNCSCSVEILLIDDGSPGPCPGICDELAAEHSCIRVIHQENQGLSGARNRGVQESRGTWLAFVDSDDYLEEDFLENLWQAAGDEETDLVISGILEQTESGQLMVRRILKPAGSFSPEEVLRNMLLSGGGWDYAVNKLYRRRLFDALSFPRNRYYEDAATGYLFISKARKIAVIDYAGYYYIRHGGTITYSKDLKIHMDLLKGRIEKWTYIHEHMPDLEPLQKQEIIQTCGILYVKIYGAGLAEHKQEASRVRRIFLAARKKAAYPTVSNRLTALLLTLWPGLYVLLAKYIKKRNHDET